jgi:alpha-galactosidase
VTGPRTLSNDHISVELDGNRSQWVFTHAGSGVRWASPFPRVNILDSQGLESPSISSVTTIEKLDLGDTRLKSLGGIRCGAASGGCYLQYEWLISPSEPYILWRWSLRNQRSQPIVLLDAFALVCANQAYLDQSGRHDTFTGFSNNTPGNELEMTFPGGEKDLALYLPGWQSWSYGGWVMADDRIPRSWLRPLTHPMIYDKSIDVPKTRGHFRSEMFAALVDTKTGTGITLGYASQRESFGTTDLIIQGDRKGAFIRTELDDVCLDPGETFTGDWACILMDSNGLAVVDKFTALTGMINQARIPDRTPVGWCSWYDYGQAISEEIIEKNVDIALALKQQVPLNTIQIDDGFQSDIGDWLTVGSNFKSGMESLAAMIHARDFTAGLWLAPFIGLRRSTTIREHPEWILRNKLGLPVNTGVVWNQFGRAFDPSHPEFLDYLQRVISTATLDWGFRYLKLDFLYAGALPGRRYNPHHTRAQAFYKALQLIRETAGESITLVGCGCPLGPAIGIFDSMRIGPDVAATWKPSRHPFTPLLQRETTLPAAVNSIRNTLNRAHLHRHWWINDPDCVLVRDERSQLSYEEIQSLVTAIGMSGGSTILSDRLESLSVERLDLLGMLIPPLSGRMQLIFPQESHNYPLVLLEQEHVIGKWWLLACFNTTDRPHHFNLALDHLLQLRGNLHIFNVWQEMYFEHDPNESLQIEVQGHSVVLLAIRNKDDSPTWIGDNIHISQGLVVEEWFSDDGIINMRINAHRICDARASFFIPGDIQSAYFNGDLIPMHPDENGIAILELDSMDEGGLEIHWSRRYNDY